MPAIDVLMPVRNGVRFLGESIESITAQTYGDWRLLILDHGSTDGSTELAHRYAERDARIEVVPMRSAQHLGGLLNAGLERCDCHYVMRHDADDIALPNRMALMNDFYAENREYVVVGGEALMIDATGRVGVKFLLQSHHPPHRDHQLSRFPEDGSFLWQGLPADPAECRPDIGKPLRRGLYPVRSNRIVRTVRQSRRSADQVPGA